MLGKRSRSGRGRCRRRFPFEILLHLLQRLNVQLATSSIADMLSHHIVIVRVLQSQRVGHPPLHHPTLRLVFRADEVLDLTMLPSARPPSMLVFGRYIRFRGNMSRRKVGFPVPITQVNTHSMHKVPVDSLIRPSISPLDYALHLLIRPAIQIH